MRRFFQAYQKRHLWLLADLALLAAFLLARHQKAWMNALADHVTTPLKTALGRLWGAVPFWCSTPWRWRWPSGTSSGA